MTALFCLYGGELPATVLRRPDEVIALRERGHERC
jgi:hypothetical protein